MKTYRICYSYNNGTNMSETVNAQSGIDAFRKAKRKHTNSRTTARA